MVWRRLTCPNCYTYELLTGAYARTMRQHCTNASLRRALVTLHLEQQRLDFGMYWPEIFIIKKTQFFFWKSLKNHILLVTSSIRKLIECVMDITDEPLFVIDVNFPLKFLPNFKVF